MQDECKLMQDKCKLNHLAFVNFESDMKSWYNNPKPYPKIVKMTLKKIIFWCFPAIILLSSCIHKSYRPISLQTQNSKWENLRVDTDTTKFKGVIISLKRFPSILKNEEIMKELGGVKDFEKLRKEEFGLFKKRIRLSKKIEQCPCDSTLFLFKSTIASLDATGRDEGGSRTTKDSYVSNNYSFGLDKCKKREFLEVAPNICKTLPYPKNEYIEVAVIDSGIDCNHPEFKGKLWNNPDTSKNECLNVRHVGYDFKNQNEIPTDSTGHGTHVSGIIVGANTPIKIMSLKAIRDSTFDVFSAICAMKYAIRKKVDIINCSWGFYAKNPPPILREVLFEARDSNILVITAAGNGGLNIDKFNRWPASFSNMDNVITVGSLNKNQNFIAEHSNYGDATVDLLAPGISIYSAKPFDNGESTKYQYMCGTSMAAGYVSRFAAKIKYMNPEITVRELKQEILDEVETRHHLYPYVSTGGFLRFPAED